MVDINLEDNALIDADLVSLMMLVPIVRVQSMSHVCRNQEGTLNRFFEAVGMGFTRVGEQFINSVK